MSLHIPKSVEIHIQQSKIKVHEDQNKKRKMERRRKAKGPLAAKETLVFKLF